jgi:sulfate adenylyltransferase subunit 1 (EFTu-like GTPase family)
VIRPRPGSGDERRRYAGTLAAGHLRPGDAVVVLPSGERTTVRSVDAAEETLTEAGAGAAVTVQLADELDVGRGDLIAHAADPPGVTRQLEATLCWFAEKPLLPRARLLMQHTTRTTKAIVTELVDRLDVVSLDRQPQPPRLEMNDLGTARLTLAGPVAADTYDVNRASGSFILLDEATNDTVAAGLIRATHL